MATKLVRTGIIEANGAQLYHEIRGDGPPVVCIPGAFGDAGNFQPTAELLAESHTVVTYDRRGNSRSPKPDDWTTTNVAEQADDCLALIEALGLERPAVVGNSGGGMILVGLLERHPESLRGAVLHEPMLPTVCPGIAEAFGDLSRVLTEGMSEGPEKVLELFARFVFGDEGFEARRGIMDPEALSRMAGNVEVTFGIERGLASFVPDADALAAVGIPVHAAYGEENEGTWLAEGAEWVSKATGGPLRAFPGAHLPRPDQVPAFADALREVLMSMS